MTTALVRRFLADYARNGPNLLLLVVVPATFVVAAAPALADAAKVLGGAGGGPAIETVTAGWAAAFLAGVAMYFQVSGSRGADRRLAVAGMRRSRLALARLFAGALLAALATGAALVALAAKGGLDEPWRVASGTLLFALVYVGLGTAVGALVPSALNGTVLLLFVWILDVFFGPTLSGSDAVIVRLLPTHFASLWTVDIPSRHGGPSDLLWALLWAGTALVVATVVIVSGMGAQRRPVRRPGRWAQLRAGVRMGWKDWRRTPVLWVLLPLVPAVFILLADAITPSGEMSVVVREDAAAQVTIVDPADIHAATMAPIAVASLATLAGLLLVLDSRRADRRLALAGASPVIVLAARVALVLVATGVATAGSLLVTALVFDAEQWGVYAAGNALVAVTYALIGIVLGPLFGRVSGVFLAFLVPFLDLGIWQSPMLRAEPTSWASWLPGHGGGRVVIDGALTTGFDEGWSVVAALLWILVLGAAAAVVATPRVGRAARTTETPRGPMVRGSARAGAAGRHAAADALPAQPWPRRERRASASATAEERSDPPTGRQWHPPGS